MNGLQPAVIRLIKTGKFIFSFFLQHRSTSMELTVFSMNVKKGVEAQTYENTEELEAEVAMLA